MNNKISYKLINYLTLIIKYRLIKINKQMKMLIKYLKIE